MSKPSSPPQLIDWGFIETAKGYLIIMYPQFSRDQIEIAVANQATSIAWKYYVCVWVHTKEPDSNGRNLKLLEVGPVCQSVEEAFRSYVDARLIPEVSAKTRAHVAKTRMTSWRVPGSSQIKHGSQAVWPSEDSSRPSNEAPAPASRHGGVPPPTYAEAESNSRVGPG